MHAYLILTFFSQITALFGTTRLFIFDKKSPLHDYLGIHDFGFGDNPSLHDYLGMHDFDMESKS